MRRYVLALAAACAFVTAVPAQQGPPTPSTAPGTVPKNRAPVSKEILKVRLPRSQEASLSNGVHLIVIEDHARPRFSFNCSSKAPVATTIRHRRPGSRDSRQR